MLNLLSFFWGSCYVAGMQNSLSSSIPAPIPVTKTQNPKAKPDAKALGFGKYFTDHMFLIEYEPGADGKSLWHSPRIVPYGPLPLDPGASVLHYGQALFEGMKAFYNQDQQVVLFRPFFNFERMQTGAERLCMACPPKEMMFNALQALLQLDREWVPKQNGCALYIRPTLIGTEGFLGVRPSSKFLFYIILSPVGAYYKEGLNPVKIWVEENYVRASKGGLGATKAGANYAASLLAAENAKKKGYSQVLWLDGAQHQYIEEVGTMNVFFVLEDKVVTPELSGSILPGGTREVAITLLKSWGYKVEERPLSIQEVMDGLKKGRLREAFGTGTAAVISPVGELCYKGEKHIINQFQMGELSQRLYDEITGIQLGKKPDPFGWIVKLN